MTEQHQSNVVAAAFPAPPPFYKHFTQENIKRLRELQSEQQDARSDDGSPAPITSKIPPELSVLVPPSPPTSGTYRSFGDSYNVIDTLPDLQEQGIEQLYPSGPDGSNVRVDGTGSEWTLDRAFHLQKIAKSLLLNFLELVGILSVDPSQYGRKVEDLRTLFINAHHLLNEYRPHQARETLILMMEEQLQRSRAETEGIRQMKEKVEGVLQDIAKDIDQAISSHGLNGQEEIGKDSRDAVFKEQRRVWETLRSELGAPSG